MKGEKWYINGFMTANRRSNTFVGRFEELEKLQRIGNLNQSAIVIVYGRRRVGKTALLERAFADRNLLKIEGLEQGGLQTQLRSAVQQLAAQLPGQPITSWNPKNWTDLLRLIGDVVKEGRWTLYLEEYQWLSSYRSQLTAELKLAWDNWLRANPQLVMILCGSSPSFMINKVIRSKSLHNRSQHELHVKPLPFEDARKLLPSKVSLREAFDAYLLVGGVPEYLKRLGSQSSCFLSFAHEAFSTDGFFVNEFDRMLVSSLAGNPKFAAIIRRLAKVNFSDRSELAKALKISPGGELSRLLDELVSCGLVRGYTPLDKPANSLLQRFSLADPFLRTYFRHIVPRLSQIREGAYNKAPASAVSFSELSAHLGNAFEQLCVTHTAAIAAQLGFAAVDYRAGAYFSRVAAKELKGYQLDLVFQRADHVHTICEIKYTIEPVESSVITPLERAVKIYSEKFNERLDRVLISAAGASPALVDRHYFDRVLTLEQLAENL